MQINIALAKEQNTKQEKKEQIPATKSFMHEQIVSGKFHFHAMKLQVNLDMTDHCTTDFCI